jgi:polysaccharide export outer membrane protein
MQAAGRNPGELKDRIEEQLARYLDGPNVTVMVDAIQSYRVFVTGQVAMPGELMSEKPISVLQAIALAGGFLDFAESDRVVIIRNTGDDSTLFRFNYSQVIDGRNFNQNMLLRSGDVVVVP